MTLTCNKKAYPDLKKECEMCSMKAECVNNGKGVFVALAEMPINANAAMPILQDNSTITIHAGDGFNFGIYRRDIEKSLKERFNPMSQMLGYGA